MQNKRLYRGVLVVAAAVMAVTLVSVAPASAESTSTSSAVEGQLSAYRDAHPGDFAGLDALDRRLTGGGLQVEINGVAGTLTGQQAQRVLDSRRAQASSTKGKSLAFAAGIPAYTVIVYSTNLIGPPARRQYSGYWDFPDSWAGRQHHLTKQLLIFGYQTASTFRPKPRVPTPTRTRAQISAIWRTQTEHRRSLGSMTMRRASSHRLITAM